MNLHCAEGQECTQYGECALLRLRRSAPAIADHIQAMVGQYGLREVVVAVEKQRLHHDSYEFEVMASLVGGSVVRQYEDGERQEKEALMQVALCHGII